MNKLKIVVLLLGCVAIMQSCKKGFEDMNKDPKNPTVFSLPMMFNGVIKSLQLDGGEMSAIHSGTYYFQSQLLGNAKQTYPLVNGSNGVWSNYYMTLKNIRAIQNELAGNTTNLKTDNVKACLDVILAYKTLRMVDYVGDMPFTKAGKGNEGIDYYTAPYDKQQDIYKTCITSLLQASNAIVTGASDQMSYGSGDTFFKGDLGMWRKFANSLVLRYAMQVADADPTTYKPIIAQILGDPAKYPMIGGTEDGSSTETVGLWPKRLGSMVTDHAWQYRENNNSCLGTTMWKMMSGNDNTNGSGIFDPRCYVFFETNIDGDWKAYPQNPAAGTPVQDRGPYLQSAYPAGRDKAATMQEWTNKGAGCRYSPVNFYLATNNDFIPELMLTVAEVNFLKAEAYNRGIGVSKDPAKAKSEYEAGIRASLNFWYNQIVKPCDMWKMNKPVLTQAQIDNYLTHVAYSTDEATALKQIYAQIWIDAFREPWVAFNLYRRTLATPRDESGAYDANAYKFYRVIYPSSENDYNNAYFMAATNGSNTSDKKLFWHK